MPQAHAVQRQRLRAILERNAATEYGRRYGFVSIRDEREYRSRVPVVSYESLSSYVDRIAGGEQDVLVRGCVTAFEETGGTTRGPKLVPYTEAGLEAFRRALLPWLDDLANAHPQIAAGRAYWAISPAARAPRKTAGGIPIGLPGEAAYFGEALAPQVLSTLAVPPEVGAIADVDAWREATCLHLLACDDLALISVWSPTFLSGLLAHIGRCGERLSDLLAAESSAYRARPARIAFLRERLRHADSDPASIWPRLQVVSCWDQGSSVPYAKLLRERVGPVPVQGKGLLATEGVVSIPLQEFSMPVLAVDSGYFEFVDDAGGCRAVDDVTPGDEYQVLMTTESGLYRYAIGDRVRVRGFAGEAPTLEFLGRGAYYSDLCGEKLTEQLALASIAPLALRFAMLAPADEPGYLLFVDADEVAPEKSAALARSTESALSANPQYAYARTFGQLAPLGVRRCVRPLETWLAWGLGRGQRLGDIKPPALSSERDWQLRFEAAA